MLAAVIIFVTAVPSWRTCFSVPFLGVPSREQALDRGRREGQSNERRAGRNNFAIGFLSWGPVMKQGMGEGSPEDAGLTAEVPEGGGFCRTWDRDAWQASEVCSRVWAF